MKKPCSFTAVIQDPGAGDRFPQELPAIKVRDRDSREFYSDK